MGWGCGLHEACRGGTTLRLLPHAPFLTPSPAPSPAPPTPPPHLSRAILCRYGNLAELTYVGSDRVEGCNLGSLVGLHGSYLNGLARRADAHAAGHLAAGFPGSDLITFLREQWAAALYHEAFPALAAALSDALLDGADPAVPQLAQQLSAMVMGAAGEDEDVAAVVDFAIADATSEAVGVGGRNLGEGPRGLVEGALAAWLRPKAVILPGYRRT